jgi:hypothetical protein
MKTFVDGEILTASDLNANFAALGTLIQRGAVNTSGTIEANGGNVSASVLFDKPFDHVPTVVASSSSARVNASIANVSVNGFTLNQYNWTTVNVGTGSVCYWIAIA